MNHKGRSAGERNTPRDTRRGRLPLILFAIVCVIVLGGAGVFVLATHGKAKGAGSSADTGPFDRAAVTATIAKPYLLFRSTALDAHFGTLAVEPLGEPQAAPRAFAGLKCDRVDVQSGTGLCLERSGQGSLVSTKAIVFNPTTFKSLRSITLSGYPSRVKVSPDGHYGATTNFVAGDTYASHSFSTRTDLLDLDRGTVLFDLEKLTVTKDGKRFSSLDFNFWGVTFTSDNEHFYATLGTGGGTYLIEGDIATRSAKVLRAGVECPSLSPDGTRIAFKTRNPGNPITWHISVLDLKTLKDHPVAESADVDDQVAWLDDQTLMYAVAHADANANGAVPGVSALTVGGSIQTDTFTVPADGSGESTPLLTGAWSAIAVHP
jgi:hypothetical protein